MTPSEESIFQMALTVSVVQRFWGMLSESDIMKKMIKDSS